MRTVNAQFFAVAFDTAVTHESSFQREESPLRHTVSPRGGPQLSNQSLLKVRENFQQFSTLK